jgi:hypothetical protein
MGWIVMAAMLVCLAIGYYFGRLTEQDSAEAMRDQARATLALARGIPVAWERQALRRPPTGELTALYEGQAGQ